jgi:hypothetical protein
MFIAIRRLQYWPATLKQAKIIMVTKPGKNPTDVASYRPISLLQILSKILGKLLLKRIYSDINLHDWLNTHQFGFRKAHSTIQQYHRITDVTNKAFKEQKYCSAVFLDVSQAFDKVWYQGLLFKIKQTLPTGYLNILKSYLSDRYFTVSLNNKTSSLIPMLLSPPRKHSGAVIVHVIHSRSPSIRQNNPQHLC